MAETTAAPNNKAIIYRGKPQRERPRENEFMPFVSRAQQRWGNSPSGREALGGQAAVDEWNSATPKGKRVPERVKKVNKMRKRGVISDKAHDRHLSKYGGKDDQEI